MSIRRESLAPKNVNIPTAPSVLLPSIGQYEKLLQDVLQKRSYSEEKTTIISRAAYQSILNAIDSSEEDSEYRKWASANFRRTSLDVKLLPGDPAGLASSRGLPIAVQEQFYRILCTMAQNGDLMTTPPVCAYDFLPEQLVQGFAAIVKTNTYRPDDMVKARNTATADTSAQDAAVGLAGRKATKDKESKENEPSASELLPASLLPTLSPLNISEPTLPAFKSPNSDSVPATIMSRLTSMTSVMTKDISSHEMSRETSLYRGMPNGWQDSSADFEDARDDFIADSGELLREQRLRPSAQKSHRPRIPSVAQNLLADKLSQLDFPQRPPFRSMDSRNVEPSTSNDDLSGAYRSAEGKEA